MRVLPSEPQLDLGVIDIERCTVWLRANFNLICRSWDDLCRPEIQARDLGRFQQLGLAYHATAERLVDLGMPDPRPWPQNSPESVDGRPAPGASSSSSGPAAATDE